MKSPELPEHHVTSKIVTTSPLHVVQLLSNLKQETLITIRVQYSNVVDSGVTGATTFYIIEIK